MMKTTSHFKVTPEDLKLLVLATLRYATGRRSYMPSFILGFIDENFDKFDVYTKDNLAEDLEIFVQQVPPTHYEERDQAIELIRRINHGKN